MKRSALLTLFVCYCTFSFPQELNFSRKFETLKKSVPIAIINSQPNYFYVLRYNKMVHDLTVERRAKPSSEITGFTPLKMDSVNADWFDYEKLDYTFFEQDKKIYFLFEKVLNSKKTIYLKIIDTLSKSSGFIELASLEKEKSILDINFQTKLTANNNILIIATQVYINSVKKTALLFDIGKRKMDWIKKLPLENEYTGYSTTFECNNKKDLFYVLIKSRVVSLERKYMNHMQMEVPVFFYDTLILASYLNTDPVTIYKKPVLNNLSSLNNVQISVVDDHVLLQVHYALDDINFRDKRVFFLNERLTKDLKNEIYLSATPLDEGLKKQLTFYDGTDSKYAGDKTYRALKQFKTGNCNYQVSERRDEEYYKELFVSKTNLETGETTKQLVIPRKIMVFKGRMRLKNIGEAMPVLFNDQLSFIILESAANFKKPPTEFNFHKFKKENNLWGSNIVMYTINKEGVPGKKLIYHNSDFDLVPMNYQGNGQNDVVFYLSSGKFEKFAILKLNPS